MNARCTCTLGVHVILETLSQHHAREKKSTSQIMTSETQSKPSVCKYNISIVPLKSEKKVPLERMCPLHVHRYTQVYILPLLSLTYMYMYKLIKVTEMQNNAPKTKLNCMHLYMYLYMYMLRAKQFEPTCTVHRCSKTFYKGTPRAAGPPSAGRTRRPSSAI